MTVYIHVILHYMQNLDAIIHVSFKVEYFNVHIY